MSCADMFLPGKYSPRFTKSEVEERTVYQIYRDKLGVGLGRWRQIIRAAGAKGEVLEKIVQQMVAEKNVRLEYAQELMKQYS